MLPLCVRRRHSSRLHEVAAPNPEPRHRNWPWSPSLPFGGEPSRKRITDLRRPNLTRAPISAIWFTHGPHLDVACRISNGLCTSRIREIWVMKYVAALPPDPAGWFLVVYSKACQGCTHQPLKSSVQWS